MAPESKSPVASMAASQTVGSLSQSASNKSSSEVFAEQVDRILQELVVTGYDATDSGFLIELDQLIKIGSEIGFTKVSDLLQKLGDSCESYMRYNSNEYAQHVTQAVAHLHFALSFLNFGKTAQEGGNESAAQDVAAGSPQALSPQHTSNFEADDDYL